MIARIRSWLDECCAASESQQRCVVARTRQEGDRLRAACDERLMLMVHPKLYARPAYWDSLTKIERELHKLWTLQDMHPAWVFAGPSAAVAHGLATSTRFLTHAWLACSRQRHCGPTKAARRITVSNDQPTTVRGLKVTSFDRTVGDCLRLTGFHDGLALADSALRSKSGLTRDDLTRAVHAACRRTSQLERSDAIIALADGNAESGGESIARAVMLELGLASPELQLAFPQPAPSSEPYRVDFAWLMPTGYILGELDGMEKYTSAQMLSGRSLEQAIRDEHRRQSYIEAREDVLRMVRFGFSDVLSYRSFLELLTTCGVPRTCAYDAQVLAAGGVLRCR